MFNNGSGGESVFGKKFKDERNGLLIKHNRRGLLSMGNSGKNSNTSQFFITFGPAPQCDGKHVCFGEVVSGFDTVQQIEDNFDKNVVILGAGAFDVNNDAPAGFWLRVPDNETFLGFTPVFHSWPRVKLECGKNEEVEGRFKLFLRGFGVAFVDDELDDELPMIKLFAKQNAPQKKIDEMTELVTTPKLVREQLVDFLHRVHPDWVLQIRVVEFPFL